ncbi:MAG: hypothetical protein JXA30_16025 [Deltaproteobacteria bacterium]|nr:hypothetical protein [Deltaproteobacteria bacterium]
MIDKNSAGASKAVALGVALSALAALASMASAQQPDDTLETGEVGQAPADTSEASAVQETVAQPADTFEASTTQEAIAPSDVWPETSATPEAIAQPAEPPAARTTDAQAEQQPHSWFSRPSLTVGVGEGADRWTLTLFGFAEADFIYDSTRSYDDAIGGALVARKDTYDGRSGRMQFSVRNSRLGFELKAPRFEGITASAVLVGDFFGNQQGYPKPPATYSTAASEDAVSENAFFNNPALRLRHGYLKLRTDYIDILAGQTYDVFGWQNYFFPCSVEFLGLPNQLFSRSTQLQLAYELGATSPVGLNIAAAALRPAQRDSGIPDVNAGLRFNVNDWKGISTPGNVGTVALPLSIGVSGTFRKFKVNAFTPPPTQNANSVTGWGLSVDGLVPIIPADNADDRGNRLTLTGSFVTGTGIGDLITAGGGATFPTLPNPAQANPPPLYHANIDEGLVSFDTSGVVHTIDWWAFRAGLQYYLPPSGRVFLSANYTQAHSKNMAELFPKGGAEIELLVRVADLSQYADVNLFWDATPAVRLGLSGQYTRVEYLDGEKPHNLRGMAQALYVF